MEEFGALFDAAVLGVFVFAKGLDGAADGLDGLLVGYWRQLGCFGV